MQKEKKMEIYAPQSSKYQEMAFLFHYSAVAKGSREMPFTKTFLLK